MKVHSPWALAGGHGRIATVALVGALALGWLVGSGLASEPAVAPQGTVTIAISPSSKTATVGEIFTLDIRIEAGSQPVDTAAAFVDFNPTYLVVVDAGGNPVNQITPSSSLPDVLQNSVDNNTGRIDYVAGKLSGTPPSGSFTLATIRFKAKAQTAGGGTPVTFVFSPPARNTEVLYQGASVLGTHVNGNVVLRSQTPTVTIAISPSSQTVIVGEIFTLDIRIEASSQIVDTAAAFVDFNPTYLTVVAADGNPVNEVIPGSTLPTVLQNSVDNGAGQIDYVAGMLTGTPPSGSFTVATIRFKAKTQTAGSGTPITFVFSPPARNTDVLYQGTSVLEANVDGNVTIQMLIATPTATPTNTLTPTPANGTLCVSVFNDLNGDGQQNLEEPWLAGALITVSTPGGVLVDTYTTDDVHQPRCLMGLPPGDYRVQEQNPPGYVLTTGSSSWLGLVFAGHVSSIAFGAWLPPASTRTPTPTATFTPAPTPHRLYLPVIFKRW